MTPARPETARQELLYARAHSFGGLDPHDRLVCGPWRRGWQRGSVSVWRISPAEVWPGISHRHAGHQHQRLAAVGIPPALLVGNTGDLARSASAHCDRVLRGLYHIL